MGFVATATSHEVESTDSRNVERSKNQATFLGKYNTWCYRLKKPLKISFLLVSVAHFGVKD